MDNWIESEPFNSLSSCRNWVDERIRIESYYNSSNYYDYECGKDCYKGDPYNQGVTYTCHTSVQ